MSVERVETTYLGYRLLITERIVEVRSPDGRRRLGSVRSLSTARRFVRGYRKAAT